MGKDKNLVSCKNKTTRIYIYIYKNEFLESPWRSGHSSW